MAPLPPNNTARWYLDYLVGGVQHTIEMRTGNAEGAAAVAGVFEAVLLALAPQMYEITVTGMRRAAEGSNITLPVPYTETTIFGSGAATDADTAGYVTFIGRSADGRRVRFSVFGNKSLKVGGDFRASGTEIGDFKNVWDYLNLNPAYFRTISGLGASWYQYANTGYNAYWRNKLR